MVFWACMLFVDLLLPGIMLLEGWLFLHKPPKQTGYLYGYRSNLSTKNEDTWAFAHATAGAFWLKWGKLSLILAVVFHLLVIGQPTDVIGGVSAALICLLMIPTFAVIPYTEKALKKHFDEEGNFRINLK